ncbi:hypothetical protein [Curvivirga aplysinae]|uniref:hypothetical protein n=1 Tax=Curvivirga aplysinae TaxID=2529852 RepID=UPI0012BCE2D1|nr:hypothetical protein [Curvivirga aplysinae]MTI09151.1 hypothetical protein [Curvivirga aplysinae]
MTEVKETAIPLNSFMNFYHESPGHHADAFVGQIDGIVTLEDYILAFFDSPIFRIERSILSLFLLRRIKQSEIKELASGRSQQFALWKTKKRNEEELLLEVGDSQIRTWFHTEQEQSNKTKLYFGSAIVPDTTSKNAKEGIGFTFRFFMGFHKLYSRILLQSALKKLKRNNNL